MEKTLQERSCDTWCNSFPVQVVDEEGRQFTAESKTEALDSLTSVNGNGDGFVSVYSFPRGHSKHGNIPQVDTLMYDLDVPGGGSIRSEGEWRRKLSNLLARVRLVAQALVDSGKDEYWRASLSGFKGVHLYQDFPAIPKEEGSMMQFKRGLAQYSGGVIEALEDASHTALDPLVDVDSSDLGRLTRHPNTIHTGATDFFGELRYCVPVSLRELTEIDVEDYMDLTRKPRPLPEGCQRKENPRAGEVISRHIRSSPSRGGKSTLSGMSYSDRVAALEEFDEQANANIKTIDHVEFLLHHKPCIFEWRSRRDAFEHGDESHKFELFTIVNMVAKDVPVQFIREFFEEMNGYEEETTENRIRDIVAWTNGFPLDCDYVEKNAPTFCSGEH